MSPTLLNKVDLDVYYINIWVCLEDITYLAFLVTKAKPKEEQLVLLHLSIPMGYMESSAFFCTTTETIKDQYIYR